MESMNPRSLTPLCLMPRSSRRSTARRNTALERLNAMWWTWPASWERGAASGTRLSFVKIVISRPSPGSKYKWLSSARSRLGCSKTNGIPSTPSQKSIEVWRSAPVSVMWCTPWVWILRMSVSVLSAPVPMTHGRHENISADVNAYMDATCPLEERVEDLLSRMTLEEKVGLMFHAPISMNEHGTLIDGTTERITESCLNHFNIYFAPGPRQQAEWHN